MKLDLSNNVDKARATAYLDSLISKGSKIELKEVKLKRSIPQNNYLHVCFAFIADASGYTIEEAKVICKRFFGSFMVYEKDGIKFLRSTASLETDEATALIDWIRQYSLEELGIYIPTPEEYIENQFQIDKELQYLK